MCNCGCNTCETKIKGPLLTEGKVKSLLSEGLQYHINKKIPLFETVYRIGSDKHLALIKEARKMYSRNIIDLCEDDEALIKTHLGEFALYEGESVPLDLPMLNEDRKYNQEELLRLDLIARRKFDCDYKKCTDEQKAEVLKDKVKVGVKEALQEKLKGIDGKACWKGYKLAGTKKKGDKTVDNCVPMEEAKKEIDEAEFKGKEVALGKPKRGGPKAYYVYVKDGDKVKKVTFGSGGLRAKIKNKEARNAFAARHNCKDKKDRTKAGYWSCNLPRYAPALGLGAKMNTFW